jgi:hypothetical protein
VACSATQREQTGQEPPLVGLEVPAREARSEVLRKEPLRGGRVAVKDGRAPVRAVLLVGVRDGQAAARVVLLAGVRDGQAVAKAAGLEQAVNAVVKEAAKAAQASSPLVKPNQSLGIIA